MNSQLDINCITASVKGYRVIEGKVLYKGNYVATIYTKSGYLKFTIRIQNNRLGTVMVHKLVAYQKYGEELFKEGIVVRHKDGNSLNNLPENILIGTQSQNMLDRPEQARVDHAIIASSYIKKHDHEKIIDMHKSGKSYTKIMSDLGIKSKGTISFIVNQSSKAKTNTDLTPSIYSN